MKRPKEKDYFEYRGDRLIMDFGHAENYMDSLEEYIDYLEARCKLKNNGDLGDVVRRSEQLVCDCEKCKPLINFASGYRKNKKCIKTKTN